MKGNAVYTDIDLTFSPDPLSGDLVRLVDQEAIKRSVKSIFNLQSFDIPFKPKFRSSVKDYLFEQVTANPTLSAIEQDIEWLVKKMEPRITLKSVDANATDNGLGFSISVVYAINSIQADETLTFTVEKQR